MNAVIERPLQPVFIALQLGDIARSIVEAIVADNPTATVTDYPAMVKIEALGRLVIRRASVEERIGRDWDLQELHLSLISLSGSIDETDDEFCLHWG
ncbi:MAG: MmoB/DmpM family protein [Burkholderiaceae bacterium]|nr:MmoB/DmpM family protein [Burkholderiaceae bacterium]